MSEAPITPVHTELQGLLEELYAVENEITVHTTHRDHAIAQANATYAPEIDPLVARREAIVKKVADIFTTNRSALISSQSKTLFLRGGTLSVKLATAALEVTDENRAIRALKRLGKLRLYTNVGKRTIDKSALKKNPELVNKLPGVTLKRTERLTIKLAELPVELVRDLHPLRHELLS